MKHYITTYCFFLPYIFLEFSINQLKIIPQKNQIKVIKTDTFIAINLLFSSKTLLAHVS